MNIQNISIKIFYSIYLLTMLTSCIGRSPASTFYILPVNTSTSSTTNSDDIEIKGPIIAIEFVTIPDYLKQPQIVIHEPKHILIKLAEYHRWSEPLAEGCKRVLQQTISNALSEINGIVVNKSLTQQQHWNLRINIIRLDGYPNGSVTLDAVWTLTHINGKDKIGRFTQTHKTGSSIADMVTTQGLLLEKLGLVIGQEIRQQLPYTLIK